MRKILLVAFLAFFAPVGVAHACVEPQDEQPYRQWIDGILICTDAIAPSEGVSVLRIVSFVLADRLLAEEDSTEALEGMKAMVRIIRRNLEYNDPSYLAINNQRLHAILDEGKLAPAEHAQILIELADMWVEFERPVELAAELPLLRDILDDTPRNTALLAHYESQVK